MDYILNNLNLALVPFPSTAENYNYVTDTDTLVSDLDFDSYGLNYSDSFVEKLNFSSHISDLTKTNDIAIGCNGLNTGIATNNTYYTLNNIFEDDVASLQQNADIFEELCSQSPTSSSPFSVTSLDDLSFDLLEKLSDSEDTISNDSFAPPPYYSSPPSMSCDEALSSGNEYSNEDSVGYNVKFQVSNIEIPSCSTISLVPVSVNTDLTSEHLTIDRMESINVKINESRIGNGCIDIDLSSPKSLDSGISDSGSFICDSPFDNTSVDLVNFLNLDDLQASTNENFISIMHSLLESSGKENEEFPTDISSPGSIVSDVSKFSDESDVDGICINQSATVSSQYLFTSGDGKTCSVDETVSSQKNHRYVPYKDIRKEKSPEQKCRKKKQNRNAASKYRSKKKEQFHVVFSDAEKLEGQNKELKEKVDGLRKEIDYLKSLMLDVINAKLSKKKDVMNMTSLL